MNPEKVILTMGIDQIKSYVKVAGGYDSIVWKVETDNGYAYALRILPKERYQQYVREQQVIQLAYDNGIQVPKIHMIKCLESCSAMLMDWIPGRTIFEALQEYPSHAERIGYEFGRVQASINSITKPDIGFGNWFSPGTKEEKDLHIQIELQYDSESCLLHLDYHPLNVLTDGEKITGVIDWANASSGDYRYDIARTQSIFRVIETKLKHNIELETIATFEKSWIEGYESLRTPVTDMGLFNKWADHRTKRDIEGKF